MHIILYNEHMNSYSYVLIYFTKVINAKLQKVIQL